MGHPGPADRRHHRPRPVPPAGAGPGRAVGPARRRAGPGPESLTPEAPVHPLAQANTQPLPVPQVDWRAIAPELALATAGVVLLLVVAFWPRAGRNLLAGLTMAGLAVAGALTAWNWDLQRVAF